MILGLDYYNVISQFPQECTDLAKTFLRDSHNDGRVYIISAVGKKRLDASGGMDGYRKEIEAFGVPCDEIIILYFENPDDVPHLKYMACLEKKVDLFIDDREDTVNYLHNKGIMALKMPKPPKPQNGQKT